MSYSHSSTMLMKEQELGSRSQESREQVTGNRESRLQVPGVRCRGTGDAEEPSALSFQRSTLDFPWRPRSKGEVRSAFPNLGGTRTRRSLPIPTRRDSHKALALPIPTRSGLAHGARCLLLTAPDGGPGQCRPWNRQCEDPASNRGGRLHASRSCGWYNAGLNRLRKDAPVLSF